MPVIGHRRQLLTGDGSELLKELMRKRRQRRAVATDVPACVPDQRSHGPRRAFWTQHRQVIAPRVAGRHAAHSGLVAFNADFWVVVGTASPVIAVANAVALTQATEAMVDLRDARRARARRKTKAPPIAGLYGWRSPLTRMYWLAAGSFLLNAWLLVTALGSLSDSRNVWPPVVAEVLIAIAMLLVLSQILSAAEARSLARRVTAGTARRTEE